MIADVGQSGELAHQFGAALEGQQRTVDGYQRFQQEYGGNSAGVDRGLADCPSAGDVMPTDGDGEHAEWQQSRMQD